MSQHKTHCPRETCGAVYGLPFLLIANDIDILKIKPRRQSTQQIRIERTIFCLFCCCQRLNKEDILSGNPER